MTELTAPYQAQALETVRQSHRQEVTATLTPATGEPLQLVVNSGSVTFSEDWSPHAQVELSCVGGQSVADLLRMDPRLSPLLEVKAGYVYPGQSADVQLLATTHLVERRVVTPGDTLELVAASAEHLAQDVVWMEADQVKSFQGVLEATQWLLTYAGAGEVDATQVSQNYRPDLVAAVALKQGSSVWSVVLHIATAAGLWLYVAADGTWQLAPKVHLAGQTTAWLAQGGGGSLVYKADDVLSRNGYYTAAIVRYAWEDANGSQEIVGTWAPTPAAGALRGSGQKTLVLDRQGSISQYWADEAARLVVENVSTRGDSYLLEAVACYWLRPGHTVQVDLANGSTARHIVKQVVLHLGNGSMTVTTREPSNLGESS